MNRLKKLLHQANSIKGATIILVVTLLLSNILGLIRDHFLAQKIPTSILDTYYAAFRIPDFIFNLFILGAISAALIPVFTEYKNKNSKEAWHITNSFLNIAVSLIIISAIVLYFLMPNLIGIFVSNFSGDKKDLTINLARILLLSPIFFSLSYIIGGILNSYKRFFVYALAPLIYNLSIIIATVLFADRFGVKSVVYGVVIGAFLHFLIQVPAAIKLGYHYQLVFDFTHRGVKKIINLMIPRALGLGAMQAMLIFYTFLASAIGAGSIAVFNLADNIQTMPLVVFGTSFATALFPSLSLAVAENKLEEFNNYLLKGIRSIIYILIPSSVGIILLRTEIVRLILGSGNFGWDQTVTTANILGIFMISLTFQGLVPLLSRSFYALQNTITPTIISIISIIFSVILGYALAKDLGVLGLALAFTIGSIINFLLLFIKLRNKLIIFKEQNKNLSIFFAKILLSALIMALIIQLSKNLFGSLVDMHRFWGVMAKTIISIIFGGISYCWVTWMLKCEEFNEIKNLVIKKLSLNAQVESKNS